MKIVLHFFDVVMADVALLDRNLRTLEMKGSDFRALRIMFKVQLMQFQSIDENDGTI